jgi:hypothetical protein
MGSLFLSASITFTTVSAAFSAVYLALFIGIEQRSKIATISLRFSLASKSFCSVIRCLQLSLARPQAEFN